MRSWTRRVSGLAVSLLAAGVAAVPLTPAAGASTTALTSATVVSQPGDFIGRGRAYTVYGDIGTVEVSGGPADMVIAISADSISGEPGEFSIRLVAPAGEALAVGTYEHVRFPGAEPEADRAGLRVYGPNPGCNSGRGRFTILDVAYTGETIHRLHLLYEQHCNGGVPAVHGEVRYQEPTAATGLLVVPGRVAWPAEYPTVGARPVPVTLVNTGQEPVDLRAPQIVGDTSGSFAVVSNACPSRLAVGDSCVVNLRFIPASAGAHAAVLEISDGTGGSRRVPLSGEGHDGTTSWQMREHDDDPASEDAVHDWTPANASFVAHGSPGHVRVELGSAGFYTADLSAGTDQVLIQGRTYENVPRYDQQLAGPGLAVDQNLIGCSDTVGRFTVHEIAFDEDGLERLSVTFEQRCGATVLGGSIAYRAGSGAQPVPGSPAPNPAPPRAEPRFSDIGASTHHGNILLVADHGIASGYSDGTYRPRLAVTRGQMAAFLARALELPAATSAAFTDTAGSVHAAGIDAVAHAGIAGGYADGSYRPEAPVTRGQMATFLTRALNLPPGDASHFDDTAGHTHGAAIDSVVRAGIASGLGSGRFGPDEAVTREQMATFLARALALGSGGAA